MTFTRPSDSLYLQHAHRLHAAQRAATTDEARARAAADLSRFFVMAGAGRLDAWIVQFATEVDDSMFANPEDAA